MLSSSLFEGYSSITSINSRYFNSQYTNEKWKTLILFMYNETAIMFYSNIILIVSFIYNIIYFMYL